MLYESGRVGVPRIGAAHYGVHRATSQDVPGIARVHVDAWRTTYRGLLRQAFLDALSYDQREGQWRRAVAEAGTASPVLVAREPEGPVVGFAAGGRERTGRADYAGELYAVYVLEPYQRHGLGSALVAGVVDALTHAGLSGLLVWVLAENPAVGFYERLGGSRVDERTVQIAGDDLEEIAFGWTDPEARLLGPRASKGPGDEARA